MKDYVIDDDTLSPERKSLLPGKGFFVPDDIQDERKDQEIQARAEDASVLVVTDPDADGLGCAAIIRSVEGEGALIPTSPHELEDGIRRAAEYGPGGATVYICDLCPDDYDEIADELELLVAHADSVTWYDHHQWTDDAKAAVADAGVDLVVGDSDEECTADVAVRSIDGNVPKRFKELAAVTRDHDLWLKEDPRSDDIADLAYWEDDEAYIEVVEEYGADLPEHVMEYLAERRVEKEDLIERAVNRADIEEIRDVTVGVTYGRCSQNEVAETLRQDGCDAAVIVKPSGSASIRGSEGFERAHEVARRVGGGGHPRAAGCKPNIYNDMLDYAHHWTTRGAVTKQIILEAFWDVTGTEPEDELEAATND